MSSTIFHEHLSTFLYFTFMLFMFIILYICQCWARVIFLSTRHAVLPTRHASLRCFFDLFSRVIAVSRHASYFFNSVTNFFYRVIKYSHLKSCFNANTDIVQTVQSPSTHHGGHIPTGQLPPHLAVVFHPPPCHQPPPLPQEVI